MKLYGSYTSPFVRHCRVALEETGEQYQFVETDYTQSAEGSPAKRVPFMYIGSLQLHDSAAIIKYVREHTGGDFLSDLETFDLFCLVNTALDTCINLFLLDRDGVKVPDVPYLGRQQARIDEILNTLDQRDWSLPNLPWNDATIRLACFLDWARFRNRLDLTQYPNLVSLLNAAYQHDAFARTAPPAT